MAIASNLLAIAWHGGRYAVASQITAKINTSSLRDAGVLHDVSQDSYYLDEAAIVQKAQFRKFLTPETDYPAATAWWSSLPAEVMFIVVHLEEWESGLG
jgi:hypothetical protein